MEFSCEINALEIQEILYRRYANNKCIYEMPILEFIDFVKLAIKKEEEDNLRSEWSAMLPFMSLKLLKYMSFKEYCDKSLGRDIDNRPTDVILNEIKQAHQRMKGE